MPRSARLHGYAGRSAIEDSDYTRPQRGESRGASFIFTSRGIHAVAVSLNQMGMDRGNKMANLTGRVNDERFGTAGYGRHRAH